MTPHIPQPDPRRSGLSPESTVRDVRRPTPAESGLVRDPVRQGRPTDPDATPRTTPIMTGLASHIPSVPPAVSDAHRINPLSSRRTADANADDIIDAAAVSNPAFMRDKVVGQYRLVEQIGAGSVGVVYRGVDTKLDRPVAVKFLFAGSGTVLERFRREATLASQLNHPHVVTVYQAGQFGPIPYIATELADGGSLEQRIRKHGPLPVAEAVSLIRDVALGLDEVHRLNILHRDLKPGNILLDASGSAKLADFGLAKQTEGEGGLNLTKPGRILGSVPYLAPEILRGEAATVSSDLYSLGCTLYHSLTGQPPFGEKPVALVLTGHLRDPLPDVRKWTPDCPESLMTILRRCCAKRATDRPGNAGELAEMLEDVLYGLSASNPSVTKRLSRGSDSRFKSLLLPSTPVPAEFGPTPASPPSVPSMTPEPIGSSPPSGQPGYRANDIFATSTELFDASPLYSAVPPSQTPTWVWGLLLAVLAGVLTTVLVLELASP